MSELRSSLQGEEGRKECGDSTRKRERGDGEGEASKTGGNDDHDGTTTGTRASWRDHQTTASVMSGANFATIPAVKSLQMGMENVHSQNSGEGSALARLKR